MSSEGGGSSTFIFLIASLLFYLFTRSKKKPPPAVSQRPVEKPPAAASYKRKEESKSKRTHAIEPLPLHSVIPPEPSKRKPSSILQKGWSKNSSLKQAFILSEIFKRVDER